MRQPDDPLAEGGALDPEQTGRRAAGEGHKTRRVAVSQGRGGL